MGIVLCTGVDPVLLETRKLILEQAGHTVITARDESAAIAACKQRSFDVAVIGQAVSRGSKKAIALTIREHCPSARILELHPSSQAAVVEFADSWLEVPADVPEKLAQRVLELTIPKRQKRRA